MRSTTTPLATSGFFGTIPSPSFDSKLWEELKSAILEDNKEIVEKTLKKQDSLLCYTSEKKRNLFHFIAFYCYNPNPELLDIIHQKAAELGRRDLLIEMDTEGSTPLHFIAEKGHPHFLKKYIYDFIPPSLVCSVLKIVNKDRRTVYDCAKLNVKPWRTTVSYPSSIETKSHAPGPLVKETSLSTSVPSDFHLDPVEILKPFIFYNPLPPLDQLVEEKEVFTNYQAEIKTNESLGLHLEIGCQLVNLTRTLYRDTVSPTHPGFFVKSTRLGKLGEMDCRIKFHAYYDKLCSMRANLPTNLQWKKKDLQKVKDYGIANCAEYTFTAYYFLKQDYPHIQAEILSIKRESERGDHCFLLIGRDPHSNLEDYKTWGRNAVVCDAWAGLIYPAFEIPNQLSDYHGFDVSKHCLEGGIEEWVLRSIIVPFDTDHQTFELTAPKP